ncbi:ATP-binding protein [Roseateles violae]|uniref:histidine kinase n=1 Tax=Roseateles violae TaxID=3058042 RepID=A0ABT8DNV3_9BURK|nr:hybrid sensor histidine kinase/response regulator [Pelomonas sp. PFR6]MDN3919653.1 hybrid sensor histidine kinase/response regulator [Pelomonas sp. PFR6]
MASEPLPELGSVDEELLQLLARQGRRVPYPVGLSAVVIAAMAGHGVSLWLSGAWVALVFAVLALRWWMLGRLPRMQDTPLRQRLRWAVGLSALNGVVFGLSLAFAPYLSDYQRMVQTILLMGLCAGSVATTAGYRPVLLAFLVPVSLANALSWISGSGGVHLVSWVDWVLGGLILGFAIILQGLGRDAYRVFAESVQIRAQQVKSNMQLRLALQQAESAMQAKTRFLASASHDLRQPMHTLSLFGAALMRRPLDPVSAEIGRNMNLALQSLASQMDALLDISKLDAQVVPVNSQVFAFSPWIARLCQELQPAAQGKGLALHLDCPDGVFVETDPMLLERVLRNLIDNAIKYTAQGSVDVRVRRDDALWRVTVRDTGCGVDPAEQARIFEEFYQVGNPERDRAKGLGLGLSIVSRLVDLLDLHLGMESTPGQGSSFSLAIGAAEAVAAPQLDAGRAAARLPQLHVLVLDDEEPVRRAMEALLSGHGCEVTTAGSTREALVKCLLRRPDIMLSDLRLRGGDDGISAVRSLRGALPGLPAVLISGDTAPERLREAHAAGLLLLHKPVLEEQLLTAIQTAMAPRGGSRNVHEGEPLDRHA